MQITKYEVDYKVFVYSDIMFLHIILGPIIKTYGTNPVMLNQLRIQMKLKKVKQYFKGWGQWHNKLGEQKKKNSCRMSLLCWN